MLQFLKIIEFYCIMWEKLKIKWGIESNFQMTIIFIVFAITGSTSVKVARPILEYLNITTQTLPLYVYWPVRILLILPVYQVLLIIFGTLFGQFKFFWAFEKKMLSRFGIKLK